MKASDKIMYYLKHFSCDSIGNDGAEQAIMKNLIVQKRQYP